MASKSGGTWSQGGRAVIAKDATRGREMGQEIPWLLSFPALQSPTRASHWSSPARRRTPDPGKCSQLVSISGAEHLQREPWVWEQQAKDPLKGFNEPFSIPFKNTSQSVSLIIAYSLHSTENVSEEQVGQRSLFSSILIGLQSTYLRNN